MIYLHATEYNTDMEAKTILLGAGEKMLAQRLCEVLNEAHYVVDLAPDGNRCKRMFNMYNYDMVLVERQLPDIDGIELCNYVRDRDADIPLMVLSRGGDESKLEVLRSRVDDYLVITQDCRELLLRIKVLARRFCRPHKQKNRIGAGDIVIDIDDKMVTKGDKSIFLSAKEFLLLKYLVCNKNRIVSRTEIAQLIYASKAAEKEYRVAAFINSLRSKMEDNDVEKTLFTVTGRGYLLAEKVD